MPRRRVRPCSPPSAACARRDSASPRSPTTGARRPTRRARSPSISTWSSSRRRRDSGSPIPRSTGSPVSASASRPRRRSSDDIGLNLKSAKALGMTTIKVADPDDALAELEDILGFELRADGGAVQRMTYRTPNGIVLVGEAHGDPTAPPVVMLHGGGQTRYAWGGTAAALAAAGRHVVNMDLRGHGDSGWAPDADYSLEAFVRDLVLVARELPHPPAVVGASLGGLAALLTAGETAPSLVSALVLVDIAPRMDPVGVERIVAFMTGNPDGFATLEEAADAIATYLPNRPRPRDLRGLQKNLRFGQDGRWRWHWDPEFMTGKQRPAAGRDPERLEMAARRLEIPVMLVRGRMSDIVSEEGAKAFLDVVPHAGFV